MHFEADVDAYARARPSYPEAMWQRLAELGLLRPGRHALDLGAGTGLATGPLLAAGLRVTAVEPGPRLAARLRADHPAAEVLGCAAEDVDRPAASVDLAIAATSIHWLRLDVVLPLLHRVLVPDGGFVVCRQVFGDPSRSTPFRERVAAIVAARDRPGRPGPDAEDVDAVVAALESSGLFTVADVSRYRWDLRMDARQVRDLFSTFSDWTAAEVARAAAAVDELGGQVVEHYATWAIVLRPCHPSSNQVPAERTVADAAGP